MSQQVVGLVGAALCLLIAHGFWVMYKRERMLQRVANLIRNV